MNPLSIALLALKGTSAAIGMAQKYITNQSVLTVLAEVQDAISMAEGILGSVHGEYADGVKEGKYKPNDANLGGIEAKKAS